MKTYDLRTNARTTGNGSRLPARFKWAMQLFIAALVLGFFVFAGARFWASRLKQERVDLAAAKQKIDAALDLTERRLWVPRWQNQTIATQPLLVRFFSNLPSDVILSEVVFEQQPGARGYRFRAGINSDRNTAARRFREMLGVLQTEGLSVISIQQLPASAGVVFEASLERISPSTPALALSHSSSLP